MDRAASCYPELHFNRSTLFQYEEMFSSALGGYSRAAELDPGWEEPLEREKQLLEYLRKVTELLQNKVGEAVNAIIDITLHNVNSFMMEGQMLNDNYCHVSICNVVKVMAQLVIFFFPYPMK